MKIKIVQLISHQKQEREAANLHPSRLQYEYVLNSLVAIFDVYGSSRDVLYRYKSYSSRYRSCFS